jgi:hypothetical protein
MAMLCSVLLAALAWWCKDALPPPERLRAEILVEPAQVAVDEPAFLKRVDGVEYNIQPRYSYDISGLVVSLHHSDSWWDYAHKEWNDHINLMDVCVIWGKNASTGAYRGMEFSNTQWECHWSTGSQAAWQAFDQYEISNNHLLTDDAAVARGLMNIHVGDQVRLRGHLVNYTILQDGAPRGSRVSSDTRTDTGPGACEVIYVDSIEALASAGRAWRYLYGAALAALVLSVVAWLALPFRAAQGMD